MGPLTPPTIKPRLPPLIHILLAVPSFSILSNLTEPLENTFINPFIHPFHHSTQLLYSCIRYNPKPRPILLFPYRCLTTIYKNRHELCLMQNSCTLKLQSPSIKQRPNGTCNFPPTPHFPTILPVPDSFKTHPNHLNSDTCCNCIQSK